MTNNLVSRRALGAAALATGASLWLGTATEAAQPVHPALRFRRGASVFSTMGWGELKPGDTSRYVQDPFSRSSGAVPDSLLRDAAQAGFDFIRFSVDPGPFIQLTGPARDLLDATLLKNVARLRRFGFAVLVDIHPNAQVPAYNSYAYTDAADSGSLRAYMALLRRTGHLLAQLNDPLVALELMNEPPNTPDPASTARWQATLEKLHAVARADAPDLLLVLAGAQADLPGLDPAPFENSNVMYTFHYYEPHDFTHQGVPAGEGEADYRRMLRGMPYPARLLGDSTDFVNGNVAASNLKGVERLRVLNEAVAKAKSYLQSDFDRKVIAADFGKISAWASRNNISSDRILLGEFGVARSFEGQDCADPISAETWVRDVRQEAERHGFGWSIWALSGGSFMRVTTTEEGSRLDPGMMQALGLRLVEGALR